MATVSPLCFTSQRVFELWKSTSYMDADATICSDCSFEYQQQMVAQQRCAYPDTTFHKGINGFVEGRRSSADQDRHRRMA